jgi:hypothetical protein
MMSKARTWIALLAVSHLVACSSTFKELSPTPSSGQPSGKAGPFLNSPFFLTLVGGVVVAGITGGYSYLKAKGDRQLAQDNARREKQTAVLLSVANDLPIYISTMGSMRKLRNWLDKNPKDEDAAGKPVKDELGRPRCEVLKEYTEFFKLYLKTRGEVAILAEVGAFFDDGNVCRLVNDEDLAIDKIHDAAGDPERNAALKAETQVFASLLGAMATEIRQLPKKTTDQEARTVQCLHLKN